jgi:hypothetical protein
VQNSHRHSSQSHPASMSKVAPPSPIKLRSYNPPPSPSTAFEPQMHTDAHR